MEIGNWYINIYLDKHCFDWIPVIFIKHNKEKREINHYKYIFCCEIGWLWFELIIFKEISR